MIRLQFARSNSTADSDLRTCSVIEIQADGEILEIMQVRVPVTIRRRDIHVSDVSGKRKYCVDTDIHSWQHDGNRIHSI